MGLHGCGKCMKFTMFVANILILAGGITVLTIGIWTCVDKGFIEEFIGSNLYMSSAYILIATGSVIIIISFIGCLGAIREIKCLLLSYFIILFIIFVILIIGGILGYVFRNQVQEKLSTVMYTSIESDYGVKPRVDVAWDKLQIKLKCCGTSINKGEDGYKVWKINKLFTNKNGPTVPESCCRRKGDEIINKTDCQGAKPSINSTYYESCYESTLKFAQDHALILGGVGIGIACLIIIGMVFAMVLFKLIE